MYKLYMRKELQDDYLGEFRDLAACDRFVNERIVYLYKKYGIKKVQFYCMDEDGKDAGGWVIEAREEDV